MEQRNDERMASTIFLQHIQYVFTHHYWEQDSLLEHKHPEQQHVVKNPRKLSMKEEDKKKLKQTTSDTDFKPY